MSVWTAWVSFFPSFPKDVLSWNRCHLKCLSPCNHHLSYLQIQQEQSTDKQDRNLSMRSFPAALLHQCLKIERDLLWGPVVGTAKPAALTGPDWLPGGYWLTTSPSWRGPETPETLLCFPASSSSSHDARESTGKTPQSSEYSCNLSPAVSVLVNKRWCADLKQYLLLLSHAFIFFCTNCNSTNSILRVCVEYFCYHGYDHQIFVVQLLSNPP